MSRASDEVRLARAALGWLAEPGSQELWLRVAEHGPVEMLHRLLATDLASTVAADPEHPHGGRAVPAGARPTRGRWRRPLWRGPGGSAPGWWSRRTTSGHRSSTT